MEAGHAEQPIGSLDVGAEPVVGRVGRGPVVRGQVRCPAHPPLLGQVAVQLTSQLLIRPPRGLNKTLVRQNSRVIKDIEDHARVEVGGQGEVRGRCPLLEGVETADHQDGLRLFHRAGGFAFALGLLHEGALHQYPRLWH